MKNIKHTFFPKNDKKNPSGDVPVYCKIKVGNTVTTFPTRKFVNPKRWEQTKQFRKTRELNEKQVRFYMDDIARELERVEEKFQLLNKAYNAQMIKNEYLGKNNVMENKSLLEAFEEHKNYFKNQVKLGQRKEQSYKKYVSVLAKVKEFLKEKHNLTDIPLLNLDNDFQIQFHLFLSGKISQNIAIKYLVHFKHIIRMAVDKGWLNKYPFQKYELTMKKKEKTYLTKDEIKSISKKEFISERLNVVRDCFLFSCYTGICFADVSALTVANLYKEKNQTFIYKNREKTEVQAKVKLIPQAEALVEKYSNHIDCIISGKLFPMRSNQKMNEYLKEIAELCEIEKHLTWHVARFSFARIAMESGMDIKVLSETLGHVKIEQTIHYCGKYSNQKVVEEMSKVEMAFA